MSEPVADRPLSILQPIESRAECPICMLPLPLEEQQSIFESCCGKIVCRGCTVASKRAAIDKSVLENITRSHPNMNAELIEFQLIANKHTPCAFCRTERPLNPSETVKRLQVRIDRFNDPIAMNQLGDYLIDGIGGLKQDKKKAMALYKRSYDLGSPEAADRLSYYNAANPKLKSQYLKEGAKRGNINSCVELGANYRDYGIDEEYAKSLMMTAAKAGDEEAMRIVWIYFRSGYLTKGELEATLKAKQAASIEVKSENREFAKRFHANLR
ncbi:hypothetical protein ACHAWT_005931 [Skeletonema menzelii]